MVELSVVLLVPLLLLLLLFLAMPWPGVCCHSLEVRVTMRMVQKTVIAQVDLQVANTKCISSFRHVTGVTAQGRGAGEINIA